MLVPRSAADHAASERELVDLARGDREAFAVLYRRYVGPIHAFAYRRSGSRTVADDVTSATFERALRALGDFRWRGAGFQAWLFRIAANELTDHFRRERRALTKVAEAVTVSDAPPAEDGVDDDVARVRAALGQLNARYQQAISLRYLAGLDHHEAAAAMNCSKPVMAVTLHRALASLRKALDRDGG